MQDRYTGDVGDFGKYGLLRFLTGNQTRRLGVVWYLCPNETGNNDGRHVAYLSDNRLAKCDPELFGLLNRVVKSGNRCVNEIERSHVLGVSTRFFSRRLEFSECDAPAYTPRGREQRIELREGWVREAVSAMADCQIVFLDSDNGPEIPSASYYSKQSPKFVTKKELDTFFRGESLETLILYQHFCRHKKYGNHKKQIEDKAKEIRAALGIGANVLALRYHQVSPRAYFLVSKSMDVHESMIQQLNRFLNCGWDTCFDSRIVLTET